MFLPPPRRGFAAHIRHTIRTNEELSALLQAPKPPQACPECGGFDEHEESCPFNYPKEDEDI
jgi:hypothetical protein